MTNMGGMTETSGEREGRLIAAIPEDTYANRLILARAHAGHLSQAAAAKRCGLNDANWANWERGKRSRTMVDDVDAIAEGLGIDRDWLLHGGALTRPDRKRRVRLPSFNSRPRSSARRPRRVDGQHRRVAA